MARLNSKVSGKGSLSDKTYDAISEAVRSHFGRYAGYAQQYLYHYARKGKE